MPMKQSKPSEKKQNMDVFQTGIISSALINHYLARHPIIINGLLKESRSSRFIPLLGQHEVNGVAVLIDGSI